jgi:DNA-binding transcriptional regulator YiaG
MPYEAEPWDADSVRALRERLGMSQRALAEELGVRQQTVSEWETGMYRPRGASARMLRVVAERAERPYHATSSQRAIDDAEASEGSR